MVDEELGDISRVSVVRNLTDWNFVEQGFLETLRER